jgi:hypothetical protein
VLRLFQPDWPEFPGNRGLRHPPENKAVSQEGQSRGPGSEGVVVNLDPISVGILEVDLFDIVGPELGGGAVLGPVAVFDIGFFQALGKSREIRHAEREMYINIVGDIFLGAGDYMQLAMVGYLEPYMFAVMEGFGYFLQPQDFLVETSGLIQVHHIYSGVTQVDVLRAGGKGYQEGGGQYKEAAAYKVRRDQSVHNEYFQQPK